MECGAAGVADRRTGRRLCRPQPDVIALQEVTRRTLPMWRGAFQLMGFDHVRASLDHADPTRTPATRRNTGVMLASRTPFREVCDPIAVPWPETSLCAAVETSRGPEEVWSLHVPNAANGLVKVKTLQAIRHSLAITESAPRVLCGDLNTPRCELPDGEVI